MRSIEELNIYNEDLPPPTMIKSSGRGTVRRLGSVMVCECGRRVSSNLYSEDHKSRNIEEVNGNGGKTFNEEEVAGYGMSGHS